MEINSGEYTLHTEICIEIKSLRESNKIMNYEKRLENTDGETSKLVKNDNRCRCLYHEYYSSHPGAVVPM